MAAGCPLCGFDICDKCWREEGRCDSEASSTHPVVYRNESAPTPCCRRISDTVSNSYTHNITCNQCQVVCKGVYFRTSVHLCVLQFTDRVLDCCDCPGDDFDLCLRCITIGWRCAQAWHILHPMMSWPI